MFLLYHVLCNWTPCQSDIRSKLVHCVCGQTRQATPLKKYRVEAIGSGKILNFVSASDLQSWHDTHNLFLGHDGKQLCLSDNIPSSFNGPIVASKMLFRGKLIGEYYTQDFMWSPDGQIMAMYQSPHQLCFWWSQTKKQVAIHLTRDALWQNSHAMLYNCHLKQWSFNNKYLLVFRKFWEVWSLDGACVYCHSQHIVDNTACCWDNQSETLWVTYKNTVRQIDLSGQILRSHALVCPVDMSPYLTICPTGQYMYISQIQMMEFEQTVDIYRIHNWAHVGSFVLNESPQFNGVFSPDSKYLAIVEDLDASDSEDEEEIRSLIVVVKIYTLDTDTLCLTNTIQTHLNSYLGDICMRWNADGTKLYWWADKDVVEEYDTTTNQTSILRKRQTDALRHVGFLSTSELLFASLRNNQVDISTSAKTICTLKLPTAPRQINWNPPATMLAVQTGQTIAVYE